MTKKRVYAYAKINLFLDISGKMDNGFHIINSVMQTVSLADVIDILVWKDAPLQIIVRCESDYAPSGTDNIASRAAALYLERAGISARVEVELKKNIPSPAGMGGGSADAAAVLRGLNEIFECFEKKELELLSAEIGSDIPFCISGGTQLARGRGEILCECRKIPDCHIVIGCGKDKMPTSTAYALIDEKYEDFKLVNGTRDKDDFIVSLDSARNMSDAMYNIFEDVSIEKCPSVKCLKELMLENGALGALMSGSGPAVFGIFENEQKALNAVSEIKKHGFFSTACVPVDKYL